MNEWNKAEKDQPNIAVQCNVVCKRLIEIDDFPPYWSRPMLSIGYITPIGWVTMHEINPEKVEVLYWSPIPMNEEIERVLNITE